MCWESRPNRYRGDIHYARVESEVGPLFAAETTEGLCQLGFILDNDMQVPLHDLKKNWPLARCQQGAIKQLPSPLRLRMLAGEKPVAMHLSATPFQQRVWQLLLAIAPGEVTSYGAMAKQLQQPQAARAVGQAVGANPLAILVPCHRVINANREPGHYHWGAELKRRLLEAERALL